jgi:hypothetical protein
MSRAIYPFTAAEINMEIPDWKTLLSPASSWTLHENNVRLAGVPAIALSAAKSDGWLPD